MRREPVLRAVMETGDVHDDPSEDGLFELLHDLTADGPDSFIIVERTADASGQTYAQVLREDDGGYLVEHRAGSADRHYQAHVYDLRQVHQILTGWAFELDGWEHIAHWSRLTI